MCLFYSYIKVFLIGEKKCKISKHAFSFTQYLATLLKVFIKNTITIFFQLFTGINYTTFVGEIYQLLKCFSFKTLNNLEHQYQWQLHNLVFLIGLASSSLIEQDLVYVWNIRCFANFRHSKLSYVTNVFKIFEFLCRHINNEKCCLQSIMFFSFTRLKNK